MVDLDKLRSIGHLSSGYKKSTRKTVKDARGSHQVEHFDGRVDVEVRPAAVKVEGHAKEGKR